jgi:hypothetical protein
MTGVSLMRNFACFATPVPPTVTSVDSAAMLHDGRSTPPQRHVVNTPSRMP